MAAVDHTGGARDQTARFEATHGVGHRRLGAQRRVGEVVDTERSELLEHREATTRTFEEVREEITAAVRRDKARDAVREYLRKLRESATDGAGEP